MHSLQKSAKPSKLAPALCPEILKFLFPVSVYTAEKIPDFLTFVLRNRQNMEDGFPTLCGQGTKYDYLHLLRMEWASFSTT